MRGLRKWAAIFSVFLGLVSPLTVSSSAFAQSTSDYNKQVAAQQTRVNELQTQLTAAEQQLTDLQNNSNGQADLINNAQSAVTSAQEVLTAAEGTYQTKQSLYDAAYSIEQSAEVAVANTIDAVATAADTVDSTFADYQAKQDATALAKSNADSAQAAYDNSRIVNGAQANSGLIADIYNNVYTQGNPPQKSANAYTFCRSTVVANIDANWGGGSVAGCNGDYVMIHYHGYITYPADKKVYFYANADDGFYMTINGQTIVNDWSLKGCGGNTVGLFSFSAGVSYPVDAWYYEWGGGACASLNYQPLGTGSWSIAPASFFTQTANAVVTKDPALKVIADAKNVAYVAAVAAEENALQIYQNAETAYDNALTSYNSALTDLTDKQSLLNAADTVLALAESDWQTASDDKAVKDAALLTLQTKYKVTFDAINTQAQVVDGLEVQLKQAKAVLAAIPKPTSPTKVDKKATAKPVAPAKVTPRGKFMPNPKS